MLVLLRFCFVLFSELDVEYFIPVWIQSMLSLKSLMYYSFSRNRQHSLKVTPLHILWFVLWYSNITKNGKYFKFIFWSYFKVKNPNFFNNKTVFIRAFQRCMSHTIILLYTMFSCLFICHENFHNPDRSHWYDCRIIISNGK